MLIICSCGKRWRVPEESAEKRFRCTCGLLMPDDADEVIMNENPEPQRGSGRVSRPNLTPNSGVPLVPSRPGTARGPAIRQSGANPIAPSPIVGMSDEDVVLPAGGEDVPNDDMLIMPTGYWPRDQMNTDELPNTAEIRGDVVVPVNKRRPSAGHRVVPGASSGRNAAPAQQSAVGQAGSVEAYVGQDFVDRVVESLATLIVEQHAVTDSLKSTQEQLTAIAVETKMLAPLAAQAARKADLFEVKGMLQGLTRELKTNFESLMKSVESRIDNLMQRMESVENSLEFYSGLMGQTATKTDLGEISGMASSISGEVSHMSQNFANISPTMANLRKDMAGLKTSLSDIEGKVSQSLTNINAIKAGGGFASSRASGVGSAAPSAPMSDGRSRTISANEPASSASAANTTSGRTAPMAAAEPAAPAQPAPAMAGDLPKDLAGMKARFEDFQERVKKLGRPIESEEDKAARANEYYDVKDLADALLYACDNSDNGGVKALASDVKRNASGLKFLKKTLGLGASTRMKPVTAESAGSSGAAPAAPAAADAPVAEAAPAPAAEAAPAAAPAPAPAATAVAEATAVDPNDNSFDGLKARFVSLQAKVQEVGALPVPQSPEEKAARFEVVGAFVADAKIIMELLQTHSDGRGPALSLEVGRVQAGLKILRKRLKS